MSINHFNSDFPQTTWWQPQPQQHEMMEQLSNTNAPFFSPIPISCYRNSGLVFDLNNEEDEEADQLTEERDRDQKAQQREEGEEYSHEIPKEPLFEKPLTPSDVGKLNRLVIPKQHAEKHFPLNGVSESGEKGLLLSFEDELGKPWRFRYSYWNSSQSYVLTKGWSRFVKEKRLDAGDLVQFERHRLDNKRMFIGWRRRRNAGGAIESQPSAQPGVVAANGGGGWTRLLFSGQPYPGQPHGPALPYPPDSFHAGAAMQSRASTPSGSSKTVRLFGVNLECQPEASAPSDDSASSPSSNQGPDPATHQNRHLYRPKLHANYEHPTHVDVNFPRELRQPRSQQGYDIGGRDFQD